MTGLRAKFIGGLILLAVLSAAFYGIQYAGNQVVTTTDNLVQSMKSMYDASRELEKVDEHERAVSRSQMTGRLNRNVLYAESLKYAEPEAGSENGTVDWNQVRPGMVDDSRAFVKVTEDGVKLPEDAPDDLELSPQQFIRSRKKAWILTGEEDSPAYAVYYYRMGDDTWFISWEPYASSPLGLAEAAKREAVQAIEEASGMSIVRFSPRKENGGTAYEPVYIPERFAGCTTAEDFGITEEMLSDAPVPDEDIFKEKDLLLERVQNSGQMQYGRTVYQKVLWSTDGGRSVTAFLIPLSDSGGGTAEKSILLLFVFLIVAGAFLSWAISVHSLVIKHSLSEEQKKIFLPGLVKKRAVVFILVGLLAVTCISVLLQCIIASFNMTVVAESVLETVSGRLESDRARADEYEKTRMKTYEECAEAIAGPVLANVDTPDPGKLDTLCEAIDAEYIIIYDENGREIISNSPYRNLTLHGGGEDINDFSRLLKGVPVISKISATDRQTGLTRSVFGAPILRRADASGDVVYWAMLMTVDPARTVSTALQTEDEIMESVTTSNTRCFSVDPETGIVLASSDPDLTGRRAADLGLPEEGLADGYMGFFRFDGDRVYARAIQDDDTLYYYTILQDRVYRNVPMVTWLAILSYLIQMALFALFLLSGYKKTFLFYSSVGDELKDDENTVVTPSGKAKRSVDPARRWVFTTSGHGTETPYYNAYAAGRSIYIIEFLIVAVYIMSGRLRTDNSAIAFVLHGNWSRGLNLFAFANVLFLAIQVSIGALFIRFLIRSVTMYIGTKGETIGRLLLNLVSYLAVIIFAYFSLSYIGVDTGALVASLGIITFALSLGAQDLVKDVLAGLAIVFDGAYQVGDIIEVNGFHGKVLEVGVRSIKIEGRGGNILIIGNRDVKNIINKTRKNSWYPLEINIPGNQDVGLIEKLLRENLPGIGEKIPEIISGPFYRGIIGIGKGTLCLSVTAECEEEDYSEVQRKLNGSIVALFEENGISIT